MEKALVYLGLVDESEAEEEIEPQSAPPTRSTGDVVRPIQGRRVEPPASASRTASRPVGGMVAGVRPVEGASAQADILVVEEFADARLLADRIRDRIPVVLDFRRTSKELTRRVVDFSSGLIYGLNGSMTKVGEGLVLVLPANMSLSQEEKRRLASLGAYELDD